MLEREFLYAPRDTFFYDIDGKRLAWTNCQPPIAVPPAEVTFINGSSGLAVTSQTDARVKIKKISREGSIFYQLLIQDATKYDVGTWQCRAKNRIGTRSANFKVTFYGKYFIVLSFVVCFKMIICIAYMLDTNSL